MHAGAQNGAQLDELEFLKLRHQTDGTPAQTVRFVIRQFDVRQLLVGAQVHRADGHRPAGHLLDRLTVDPVLLLLVGERVADHQVELAAEESNAIDVVELGQIDVALLADVGQQLDGETVGGHRRQVDLGLEHGLVMLELVLGLGEALDDVRLRIDIHRAAGAVDDDEVAVLKVFRQPFQAHDRRHVHRAQHHAGVAAAAAGLADYRLAVAVFDGDEIGGQDLAREDDLVLRYRRFLARGVLLAGILEL